jgi:endogenous inhibitor of DNA gyrase (YacG/DUF329 family)
MTTQRCPTCNKPAQPATRPFCSPGCKDRDLLAWFREDYRLPGREPAQDGLDNVGEPD